MAFQAHTMVNGVWSMQEIDLNAALLHQNQREQEASKGIQETEEPPVLGVLTQTVIPSPLVHWILPARLRGLETNDVAFIGDEFVQIKELREDGHLWDVVRKENFGARIRRARIIGSLKECAQDYDDHYDDSNDNQFKDEDDDMIMMDHRPNKLGLPPQFILLQLETGESVFLRLRLEGNFWKFSSTHRKVSKTMLRLQPGMHLAVDPSSRYIAIGCSEKLFAIYALNQREELKRQFNQGLEVRYVEAERHMSVQGVILHIEFLYPPPDDEKYIILLVVVVWKGITRMLQYEWEAGTDIHLIRSRHSKGHHLGEPGEIPLLIIPLVHRSAFIIAYEEHLMICQDILLGTPTLTPFAQVGDAPLDGPSKAHTGRGRPLWTGWARPTRLPHRVISHDDIYIVREDGVVKAIEILDAEDMIEWETNIGCLDSNSGPAVACIDYQGSRAHTGDMLITGGDAGPGGTYLIKARGRPEFIENFQNWSPSHDIVTTSPSQDREDPESEADRQHKRRFVNVDKVYACVGKGIRGAIMEIRHGLEAQIGLSADFPCPILEAWVLPPKSEAPSEESGCLFLLSLGDQSALLQLSADASAIAQIDQESSDFDLRCRTITTGTFSDLRIQVTEHSIIAFNSTSNIHTFQERDLPGLIIHATVHQSCVLFSTEVEAVPSLHLLDLREQKLDVEQIGEVPTNESRLRTLGTFPSITALGMCTILDSVYVVVAGEDGNSSNIQFQGIDSASSKTIELSSINGSEGLEPLVSIAFGSDEDTNKCTALCGTRDGIVVMLQIDCTSFEVIHTSRYPIGFTSAIIRRDEHANSKGSFFAICGSRAYSLDVQGSYNYTINSSLRIDQIRVTDAKDASLPEASIYSVSRLAPNGFVGHDNVLLIAESQLLLAGLSTQSQAVPRQLPIYGTPYRLLYSQTLQTLVVAASLGGKCTLLFIDPDTGKDVSQPVEKKDGKIQNVEFISGLGHSDVKIFRLLEWSYIKGGKRWSYIVVATSDARVLLISAEKRNDAQIRYWTKFRRSHDYPVYSVAGFTDGFVYCSGKSLVCDVLDEEDKKFSIKVRHELPSPAINLVIEDGKIYALTIAHSLMILDLIKGDDGSFKISPNHSDELTRNSLHHRILGPPGSIINLVSDRSCSIVGLTSKYGTRADSLTHIFEAQLPYSIVRFRYADCRPIWDPIKASSSGHILNSAEFPEILGLTVDGSVCNFTILDEAAWALLRFLVDLIQQSSSAPRIASTGQDTVDLLPRSEPKIMRHVDGDLLRRYLDERCLEDLLGIGSESTHENKQAQDTFAELLEAIHGDTVRVSSAPGSDPTSKSKNHNMPNLVAQAYDDLDFFLRPVF